MDLNRLTQKSQEALAAAQSLAIERGHTEVDVEHLLMALLDQPEGLVPRLISAMGADPAALRVRGRTEPVRLRTTTHQQAADQPERSEPWT